jgi:hypothetical protein
MRKIKKINFFRKDEILWQVNYYDRIIRDASELQAFRYYISKNPIQHWNKIIKIANFSQNSPLALLTKFGLFGIMFCQF